MAKAKYPHIEPSLANAYDAVVKQAEIGCLASQKLLFSGVKPTKPAIDLKLSKGLTVEEALDAIIDRMINGNIPLDYGESLIRIIENAQRIVSQTKLNPYDYNDPFFDMYVETDKTSDKIEQVITRVLEGRIHPNVGMTILESLKRLAETREIESYQSRLDSF